MFPGTWLEHRSAGRPSKTPEWCRDEALASQRGDHRFADAPEPGLREPVSKAMVNRPPLETSHRHDDAITAYAEMVQLAGAPELNVREQVAKAPTASPERLRRAKAKWGH